MGETWSRIHGLERTFLFSFPRHYGLFTASGTKGCSPLSCMLFSDVFVGDGLPCDGGRLLPESKANKLTGAARDLPSSLALLQRHRVPVL